METDKKTLSRIKELSLKVFPHYAQHHRIPDPGILIVKGHKIRQPIPYEKILWFKADGQYTYIHCKGQRPVYSSKKIGDLEDMICPKRFCRIHRSHMINMMNMVDFVDKMRYCTVVLSDGTELNVAYKYRTEFIQRLWAFWTTLHRRDHQDF